MPRQYQRKTVTKYKLESLRKAVEDCRNDRLTPRKAAVVYSVPSSTIYDHLRGPEKTPGRGHKRVFTQTKEKRLKDHIIECHQLYNVITANVVRKIAFKFAEFHKVKQTFDKKSKMAGRDWLNGFLKRYPDVVSLVSRKIESTANGVAAFDEAEVLKFFDNLMAQEIMQCESDTETGTKVVRKKWSEIKIERDKGREIRIKNIAQIRNMMKNEVPDSDRTKTNFVGIHPELDKREKNVPLEESTQRQKLLSQRYKPYQRSKEKQSETFRNVNSEPEVTLNFEVVETNDPLQALSTPGPSKFTLVPGSDDVAEDNEALDVLSQVVQECSPKKASKDRFRQLSPTNSLDFQIKEENTDDLTRAPEESLADFDISSQDDPDGDVSRDVLNLSHFHSDASESNSDSSVYFKARKSKQKVTTELLFQRYKLKSKREIDRLHSKIRKLKASVERYKREVYRLRRQEHM